MSHPVAGGALSWALDALALLANFFADPSKEILPARELDQPAALGAKEQTAPGSKP